jgi:hypothetical protein
VELDPPVLRGEVSVFWLGLLTVVLLGLLCAVLWRQSAEPQIDRVRPRLWALALREEAHRDQELLQVRILAAQLLEILARPPERGRSTTELCQEVGQPRRAVLVALGRLQRTGEVEPVTDAPDLGQDGWRRRAQTD